nr:MAG TPA: Toxin SymE, type I toxin-antitoxin system [Caudoviricetes sp.]
MPGAKELGYKLGDKVDFMVVDGKIVIGVAE